MKVKNYTIIEEKNEIDDHLLDIIGNEFKFDHQKGISEWIKNAADAYIRAKTPDDKQYIFLRFADSNEGKAVMECIDFVGMTSDDITKAFKRWGDPEAAKRGLKTHTYGGHGNGGKFYMRQMFEESYFITYRSGKLNIFGFSPNKRYGFADGFKEVEMTAEKAISFAGLNEIPVPEELLEKIIKGETGFTVVRGITPTGMKNKVTVVKIAERLRSHPQAIKLFERIHVGVVYNGSTLYERLLPERLLPKKGFEGPFEFEIPEELPYVDQGEKSVVKMADEHFPKGRLVLKTSEEALERNGRLGELNRIDVLGGVGVIASYFMNELGPLMYPQSVFIYGECECPILEDPNDDCVKNDRSKLIAENPKTKALLNWLGEKVNELSEQILAKEKQEQKNIEKKHSMNYNDFLNKWSARFLNKLRAELLVGPGTGPGMGFGTGGLSGEVEEPLGERRGEGEPNGKSGDENPGD